jgi:hypothetical protein
MKTTLLERAKAGELLTPEELAQLLKKDVTWVYEKRRPRCPNPIPAMPAGRGTLRFEWSAVYEWLKDCASKDAASLSARRNSKTKLRKKPLTAAQRAEMAQMIEDAQEFFANVERDEDGTLLCSPDTRRA